MKVEHVRAAPVGLGIAHPVGRELLGSVAQVDERLRGDRPHGPGIPVALAVERRGVGHRRAGRVEHVGPHLHVGVPAVADQVIVLRASLPEQRIAQREREDRVVADVVAHEPGRHDERRPERVHEAVPRRAPSALAPRERERCDEREEEQRRTDEVGDAHGGAGQRDPPSRRLPRRVPEEQHGEQHDGREQHLAHERPDLQDELAAERHPERREQAGRVAEHAPSEQVRHRDRRRAEEGLRDRHGAVGSPRRRIHGGEPERVQRHPAGPVDPVAGEEGAGEPIVGRLVTVQARGAVHVRQVPAPGRVEPQGEPDGRDRGDRPRCRALVADQADERTPADRHRRILRVLRRPRQRRGLAYRPRATLDA